MLGNTTLRVSALGLGCSRLGRSVFENTRRQARELLETAFDNGINFFDSAPNYAYGDSEVLLGNVFATRRDQVILATKGGYRYSSSASYARYLLWLVSPFRKLLGRHRQQLKHRSKKRQNFSARFLRKNLEQSLRRMHTDYIDLYQLHSPPMVAIESDEVLRFLEDSIKDGKVRYCAVSVSTIEEARLCLNYPVFSSLQIAFNLLEQASATEVFPLTRSRGVGVVVKTPLARGLLTNNYRIMTGPAPERYDHELQARRRRALSFLVSENHPSVEIASLRFILDHKDVASVLIGTTDPNHLRNNLHAAKAHPLSENVMSNARALRNYERAGRDDAMSEWLRGVG
jgi:aryl-alcohol dehydrogenase-like predicted oxidoreductase